jgi:DNA-binding transcriptional LysR family regulator
VDLASLELFCDIVRLHSFSRGAELHRMSQPAASQTVRSLERSLGVKLVDRSTRPFRVTPQGESYAEGCRRLLREYRAVEERVRASGSEIAGSIRVAAIYSVGLHELQQYFRQFMQSHPQVRVRVEYLRPNEVHNAVTQDQADLGLISYPKAGGPLVSIPLRDEPMVLACRPSHPLASRPAIRASDLRGQDFVAFDPDLFIRKAVDRALAGRRVQVNVIMEFDNIENIKGALLEVDAVSILPRPTLRRELEIQALVARPLAFTRLVRPLGIIHRKDKPLTPAMETFILGLRQAG